MSWTNLCIEAFCFGDKDNGNYPCGRDCPSHLCLENGHCPHLGYAKTTERDVARFPKLRLILWDRIGIYTDDLYWKLRWWFWDCLWFNRRKVEKFFDSIRCVSSEDCPQLAEFEDEKKQNAIDFKEWFSKVGK
jgi:hypothetical protein